MWRNGSCHTDSDPFRTVDQKIWHLYRQNNRLFFGFIKIRHEIHNIFIQICQIGFLRHFLQTCLCISHGSGTIAFNGPKISMPVHKRQSLFEILCHDNQGIIDRRISMRMIFTHGISDNTRTLTIRFVISDSQFIHIIKCTALHRF